ncbi:hypothetical protein [Candidatus Poriferisocius sp.]|uniref:hypothetical protein n=1 Tax=Candidatus Poriferisocius sp. TaxID=3101276 RepID=UPI003B5B0BE5
MTSANLDPEHQQKEREVGSFTFRPVPTDEWLGDVFYREYIGASGEPKGIIPQD